MYPYIHMSSLSSLEIIFSHITHPQLICCFSYTLIFSYLFILIILCWIDFSLLTLFTIFLFLYIYFFFPSLWRHQHWFTWRWTWEGEGLLFKQQVIIQLIFKNKFQKAECRWPWEYRTSANCGQKWYWHLFMDADRIFTIKDWRKLLKWESLEEKNRHHSEKSNTSHLYSSCIWVKSLNFHGEEKHHSQE